jgi:RRXRR protein
MGLAKGLAQRKFLSRGLTIVSSSETGYKNGSDASLVLPPSGRAQADVWFARLRPSRPPEGTFHPGLDQERGNPCVRVPVVDVRGIPVMPCSPPKARAVLTAGKARPKRNTLGIFYLQLTYEQAPDNQPLVVGIDPGATFEGFSVVGTKATVCNLRWRRLTT